MKYGDRLAAIYEDAIKPALRLLPANMSSREALVMLFAIGLQESRFEHRFQLLDDGYGKLLRNKDGSLRKGPARGLWHFELTGGVGGVLNHKATKQHAYAVMGTLGLEFIDARSVWEELETNDVLAAAFARLLLWSDAAPLPRMDDVEGAWKLYSDPKRTWSPGKPHRHTWDAFHAEAVAAVLAIFQ